MPVNWSVPVAHKNVSVNRLMGKCVETNSDCLLWDGIPYSSYSSQLGLQVSRTKTRLGAVGGRRSINSMLTCRVLFWS